MAPQELAYRNQNAACQALADAQHAIGWAAWIADAHTGYAAAGTSGRAICELRFGDGSTRTFDVGRTNIVNGYVVFIADEPLEVSTEQDGTAARWQRTVVDISYLLGGGVARR